MGDAVDGALDEGAVDVTVLINLKTVDLTGAHAVSEHQLVVFGIDNGKHSMAGTTVDVAIMFKYYARCMFVAKAQISLPQKFITLASTHADEFAVHRLSISHLAVGTASQALAHLENILLSPQLLAGLSVYTG